MFEPKTLPAFYNDPYNPVLLNSPGVEPFIASVEQEQFIGNVLSLAASDSRFAEKAFLAIKAILGATVISNVPVITSVEPNTKPAGSASFKLKVKGTGYDSECVIHINGNSVPTTFISATELNTDLDLTSVPVGTLAVIVRSQIGVLSNSMVFTVTAL